LLQTIPDDMATGVPTNAMLFAHYQANAQYINEPVTFDQIHMGTPVFLNRDLSNAMCKQAAGADAGMSQTPCSQFVSSEGMLEVTPPDPLVPGDDYVVHWPALRGINTATIGSTADLHFTAGMGPDMAAPTFEGVTSVSWDVSREKDSCTGQIEDRYDYKLGLGSAADDGGRDSLTLLVYESVGTGGLAPVLIQRLPASGQGVTVTSTVQVGHVCFAAIVRDLTMKVSTSGAPVCVDTVSTPFFYSCRAATASGHSGEGAVAGAALGVSAALRRASRRKGRARGRPAGSTA
jgi:hypothetical protein